MSASAVPDTAPLWKRVHAMFARALAVLGGPAAVAAIAGLTPKLRRSVAGWIAPLEHMVRKLLFVEASLLPRENHVPPRAFSRAPSQERAQRTRDDADPARPGEWRVRFALSAPRDPHLASEANAPRIRFLDEPFVAPLRLAKPPLARRVRETPAALLLARRFEALRRVLDDPMPHARRLARLLARLKRRRVDIAWRYAAAPPRTSSYDPEDPRLSVACQALAFTAEAWWRDTS